MKRANGIGVVLVFVCMGVVVAMAVANLSFTWALSAGGVVMAVLDAALRLRSEAEGKEKWLQMGTGGVFGRMPVWILGILLLLMAQIGLIEWLNAQN